MEKSFLINQLKVMLKLDNILKITTDQGDDYATGCLLDHNYFQKNYKMIATDLSKPRALDADPKVIQQITFTGNLSGNNNRLMFSIIEEAKEIILDFSQRTVKLF